MKEVNYYFCGQDLMPIHTIGDEDDRVFTCVLRHDYDALKAELAETQLHLESMQNKWATRPVTDDLEIEVRKAINERNAILAERNELARCLDGGTDCAAEKLALRAALTELVACKDLKLEIEGPAPNRETAAKLDEYRRRQPLAWTAARAALAVWRGEEGK